MTTHNQLSTLSAEDLELYASAYFISAKQAGMTFEQLFTEACAVHPDAYLILKFIFAHC